MGVTKKHNGLVREMKTFHGKIKPPKSTQQKTNPKVDHSEKAQRYQTLFENAPVGIVMLDQNDRILKINKMFQTIFQFSIKEIRGKVLNDVIIPDAMVDEARKLSYDTSQKKIVDKETYRKRKDGSLVPVQILGVPIEINKKLTGIYGMYVDITERKHAEDKLKKINRIYEVTSNINNTIVHARDQHLLFNEVCRIAVEDGKFRMSAIGLIDQESRNINIAAHYGLIGDYLQNLCININDENNAGNPSVVAIETTEYCACNDVETDVKMITLHEQILKNGYRSFCVFPLVVFGKPYGLIYLFSEDRFHFDEEEMKLLDEMAMDVSFCIETLFNEESRRKEHEELIRAKESAEEANRLKSSFLARMSHELRTPLNVILGNLNTIRDLYFENSENETKIIFGAIEDNCSRLIATMTEIFDISTIESGGFKTNLIRLSLNSAVSEIVEKLKRRAEKKNLEIKLADTEPNILVMGDEYCLSNALVNVLHNAIKFSSGGEINIILSKDENFGICSVADEGIGMSGDYQKHLFELFSQEDVSYSRPFEGVGLGLALAKKYLAFMNSSIEIKSSKNMGTTVTFKIPLEDANRNP